MKKILALMLVVVLSFSLCACGESKPDSSGSKPSGKYYNEKITDVYYEFFDGESICYLIAPPLNMSCKYAYFTDEEKAIENCYTVTISDGEAVHYLLYDAINDVIFDEDFGYFTKK